MRNHVVVVGYGTKGRSAVDTLRANGTNPAQIVVIDGRASAVGEANLAGFAAIEGDATRRDILRRVLVAEHSVSELARDYPMSVTAVQKHVAVLEEAGLVTKRRHGREQRVAGQPAALGRAQQLLLAYEQLWRGRMDRMTDVLTEDDRGGTA